MSAEPYRGPPDEAITRWYTARPRLIQLLLKSAAIILLGLALLFILLERFGTNFVLSTAYINRIWLWPAFCGAGIFVPLAILVVADRNPAAASFKMRLFAALAVLSFGAAAVHLTATRVGPALLALWLRDDISVNTTIESFIHNSNHRGCRFAIVTANRDLPPICNPPKIAEGDETFTIHGYGTPWAFFWTSIQRLH